jgi:hypothetical protein
LYVHEFGFRGLSNAICLRFVLPTSLNKGLSFFIPLPISILSFDYTDKKENQIFLIYKEIQNGAVAKSYITNGLLMGKYLCISSYIRKPFLIYDFATAPL